MPGDDAPAVKTAIPILSVAELSAALDHYRDVFGFQVAWVWGEPAHIASVCRDDVEFNLPASSNGAPTPSQLYVRMTGADDYYDKIKAAGARIAIEIADREYGLRDFRAVDPDGNQNSFGAVIDA